MSYVLFFLSRMYNVLRFLLFVKKKNPPPRRPESFRSVESVSIKYNSNRFGNFNTTKTVSARVTIKSPTRADYRARRTVCASLFCSHIIRDRRFIESSRNDLYCRPSSPSCFVEINRRRVTRVPIPTCL